MEYILKNGIVYDPANEVNGEKMDVMFKDGLIVDNVSADDLNVKELVERVSAGGVREVIVATNPTPSGDTTAAYIARILEPYGTEVSRLAYGIPVGGDIEYADEVTLHRAMEGRKYFGN